MPIKRKVEAGGSSTRFGDAALWQSTGPSKRSMHLVREEQAAEARQIIADYRAHPTRDGDEAAPPPDNPSPRDPSAA